MAKRQSKKAQLAELKAERLNLLMKIEEVGNFYIPDEANEGGADLPALLAELEWINEEIRILESA